MIGRTGGRVARGPGTGGRIAGGEGAEAPIITSR